MLLPPSDDGVFRFAAISRTALGTPTARPDALARFYERLPHLGVDRVFHLGGVSETASPLLAEIYPQVEGVETVELTNGSYAPCAGRMRASGRSDWSTGPGTLQLTSGPPSAPGVDPAGTRLVMIYDWSGDHTVESIIGSHELFPSSEIILIGGQRRVWHRYFNEGRSCVASIGVFDARLSLKSPPEPYGGSIVEIKLHPDGSLDTCTVTFRDMSGRLADVR